jgi:hypothetical protein
MKNKSISSRVNELMINNSFLKSDFNKLLSLIWEEDFYSVWQGNMTKYPGTKRGFINAISDSKLSNTFTVKRAWERFNKKHIYISGCDPINTINNTSLDNIIYSHQFPNHIIVDELRFHPPKSETIRVHQFEVI